MNIGEKIKELRMQKRMTQEALAARLCVSAQAISKWERGTSNPDLYLIPRIAEAFLVSADELLGLTSDAAVTAFAKRYGTRLDMVEQQLRVLTADNEREVIDAVLQDANPICSFDFTAMPQKEKNEWKLRNAVLVDERCGFGIHSVPIDRPTVGSARQPLGAVYNYWNPKITKENLSVDFGDIERVRLRLSATVAAPSEKLQIFFKTDTHPSWSEGKSVSCQYRTGECVDLSLSLPTADWKTGVLTGILINPTDRFVDRCEIERLELLDRQGNVCYSYSFADSDSARNDWTLQNAVLTQEKDRFILTAPKQRVYDPGMVRENLSINIDRAEYLHIRLQNRPVDPSTPIVQEGWMKGGRFYNAMLGVYFKTEADPVYSVHRRVTEYYVSRSGMVDLYVNMSTNNFWKGTLTGLRIDPCELNYEAIFNVELIEILEAQTEMPPVLLFDLRDRIERMDYLEYRLKEMDELASELDRKVDGLESELTALRAKVVELSQKTEEKDP